MLDLRLPDRGRPAEPDPRPRPRPPRRPRPDHAAPRHRRDQHRGLRAAPRLARVRRRARDPRDGRRHRRAGARPPAARGLLRRVAAARRAALFARGRRNCATPESAVARSRPSAICSSDDLGESPAPAGRVSASKRTTAQGRSVRHAAGGLTIRPNQRDGPAPKGHEPDATTPPKPNPSAIQSCSERARVASRARGVPLRRLKSGALQAGARRRRLRPRRRRGRTRRTRPSTSRASREVDAERCEQVLRRAGAAGGEELEIRRREAVRVLAVAALEREARRGARTRTRTCRSARG